MSQAGLRVHYLNSWGHAQYDEITSWLKQQFEDGVEIVCLQEVFHAPYSLNNAHCYQGSWRHYVNSWLHILNQTSTGYIHHYTPHTINKHVVCDRTEACFDEVRFGNLILLRADIKQIDRGVETAFPGVDSIGEQISRRNMQWIVIEHNHRHYLIVNVHGIWIKGNTKGDAPERLTQTAYIMSSIEQLKARYNIDRIILGGDFNLDIDTHALSGFEGRILPHTLALRNLIREYSVKNTRTSLYREHGNPGKSMYADYVFVSEKVKVTSFEVPDIPVSDHRPMLLEVH